MACDYAMVGVILLNNASSKFIVKLKTKRYLAGKVKSSCSKYTSQGNSHHSAAWKQKAKKDIYGKDVHNLS